MPQAKQQVFSLTMATDLENALLRAESAEKQLAIERQRFSSKYGVNQKDLLAQIQALKRSLVDDEAKLRSNEERINLCKSVIGNSLRQLEALRHQLGVHAHDIDEDDERDSKLNGLEAEDFRLSMNKYFQEIKLELLTVKGRLSSEQRWESMSPSVSSQTMRDIRARFVKEMRFALSKNENKRSRSSVELQRSQCLRPSDRIQGVVYTLNWSAKNVVRISRIKMEQFGRGYPSISSHYERRRHVHITEVLKEESVSIFDHLARTVKEWMLADYRRDIQRMGYHVNAQREIAKDPQEDDGSDKRYSMGIVLESLAASQHILHPQLLNVCSHHDVMRLLQRSFDEQTVPLRVMAICNAAECALMTDEHCRVGVVIGERSSAGTPYTHHVLYFHFRHSLPNICVQLLVTAYYDLKKGARRGTLCSLYSKWQWPPICSHFDARWLVSVDWNKFDKLMDIRQPMDLVLDSYFGNMACLGPFEQMASSKCIGELVRVYASEVFGQRMKSVEDDSLMKKRWGIRYRHCA